MQLQVELRILSVSSPKLLGIRFLLKAQHNIVREAHDDHVAMRPLLTPRLDPGFRTGFDQGEASIKRWMRPFTRTKAAGLTPISRRPHPHCALEDHSHDVANIALGFRREIERLQPQLDREWNPFA
jgi:hypothetical protein